MIDTIIIDNFTIIDHLEVDFSSGLSTLTGETGAGKSIIIDAITQLAGAKSNRELIRQGSDQAMIFAEFSHLPQERLKKLLKANEIDFDSDYLSIQKYLKQNGRSVIRVNGSVVNGTFLKEIGNLLFNIEEQSKHQQLFEPSYQAELLDAFAGERLTKILTSYQKTFRSLAQISTKRAEIKKKNQDLRERLDYLKFAVAEISELNPSLGEDQELEEKKIRLSNFEKISDHLQQIQGLIEGENSIQDLLGQAQQLSLEITDYSEDYQKISSELENASYAINDAISVTSAAADQLDFANEQELNLVIDRLNSLETLKKKYGGEIAAVLAYQKNAAAEIKFAENSEQSLKEYDDKYQKLLQKAQQQADELTNLRLKAASKLAPLVESELATIDFKKAKFKIDFQKTKLGEFGQDQLTFMIQTNVGEKVLPLAEIASGGELSRILLALKSIFANYFVGVTFIFDEIDSGVSGHAAQAMAEKIYQIANVNQVIAITHLPQLAAMSDHQYLIEKKVAKHRTTSSVRLLNSDERVDEIAQMLTGTKMTEVTKIHAQEMLDLAQKSKGENRGRN
ncbi:DNA repair protein RecN [Xylocopilactobacillus apicola]|uniref:DNA repair protein RecN n=1 Tax=Xylocopilactobacillus apicola TaxID=2932184 RepID=A0AAU9D703_9LACO|nr:DNA repair protein RecN [Xylocopilactobacillus apicola]BDR58151.1 DNA repair protein RecN [Xylocopilactobacillus apicola]